MKAILYILLTLSFNSYAITGEDNFLWNCASNESIDFVNINGQTLDTQYMQLYHYRVFNNQEELVKKNITFLFYLDGKRRYISDRFTSATTYLDNLDPEESHLPWSSHSVFVQWEQNKYFQNVVINIKRKGNVLCHKNENGESIKRRMATGTINLDLQDIPVTCVQSPSFGKETTLDQCEEIN